MPVYRLFMRPKFKKYAKIVSFKDEKTASESIRKLNREFNDAKTRDKKLRVARVMQYSANRAIASSKRKNLKRETKAKLRAMSEQYDSAADKLWEKYRKIK